MSPHEMKILEEQSLADARIIDESVVGYIEMADPYMVMLICGYYANLPHLRVDSVYRRNGKHYVDVTYAGRSAFDPVDITTYRAEVVERCLRGEDVEVLSFTEVEWSDGTKRYESGDEP